MIRKENNCNKIKVKKQGRFISFQINTEQLTDQVTNVQRVQNKWLYRKYAIQRHLIKDKNS